MESTKPTGISVVSGLTESERPVTEQGGWYQGRRLISSDVSGQVPSADGSLPTSRKPLREYYVSQLKDVEARSFELPDECPDWFKPYKKNIFVPLGKIYNQFIRGGVPLFNTVNAFSRNYNDLIVALMRLEKTSQEGVFTDEQKSIIAGWLDDTLQDFPVNWRELPLVVSPDVENWNLRDEDKDLESALDANSKGYLEENGREAFVPAWMNKEVLGLDLGDVYFTYYSIRNDNARKSGKLLTATDLCEKDRGLYDWLVEFQDKESILQESDISELEYNYMKHRLSVVDKEIADLKRLKPENKFKWTDLERPVDSSPGQSSSTDSESLDDGVAAGRKRSLSLSSLESGQEQSLEPASKQQKTEDSESEQDFNRDSELQGCNRTEAVLSPGLCQENRSHPLSSSNPEPLKITQGALPVLSGLWKLLPESPDGIFLVDHKLAVSILVQELPNMLKKYSDPAGVWIKDVAESELRFMVNLIDYLESLNCRQYLDGQRYLFGGGWLKAEEGSKTAYEGQMLSDEQVIWRHVIALLPLKRPLESCIEKLNTTEIKPFAEKIKSITSVLAKQLVGSLG